MRILFQGDSITDAGRLRDSDRVTGWGYALLTTAALTYERPGEYECFNRGISGNRIVDLYARMKVDIVNLRPDVMSILIGVNDVWHELARQNGVSAEKFYKVYRLLLEEVKAELPDVKLILLEPFALHGNTTDEFYDELRAELSLRADAVRRLAEEFGAVFVPLQEGFDELSQSTSPDVWLMDGVHPTPAGHEYIKSRWLAAFRTL